MNIFQIEQELKELFDTLEENGGELTPELEEALAISQTDFVNKIKSYSNVIKQLDADLSAIKDEKDRLKALEDSKKRVKERLSTIMCSAISMFGDTTRSGGKFVDYGTGKASVRNSIVCEVNDKVANQCVHAIWDKVKFGIESGNPDSLSYYKADDIQELVNDYNERINFNRTKDGLEPIDTAAVVDVDDLEYIDLEFDVKFNAADAFNDVNKTNLLKELVKCGIVELKPKVDKTRLKNYIKETGAMFNIAKLTENQSLSIK